jgi:hypothetical protein
MAARDGGLAGDGLSSGNPELDRRRPAMRLSPLDASQSPAARSTSASKKPALSISSETRASAAALASGTDARAAGLKPASAPAGFAAGAPAFGLRTCFAADPSMLNPTGEASPPLSSSASVGIRNFGFSCRIALLACGDVATPTNRGPESVVAAVPRVLSLLPGAARLAGSAIIMLAANLFSSPDTMRCTTLAGYR